MIYCKLRGGPRGRLGSKACRDCYWKPRAVGLGLESQESRDQGDRAPRHPRIAGPVAH